MLFNRVRATEYMRRYELFCRKLVLERHYTAAAFLTGQTIVVGGGVVM